MNRISFAGAAAIALSVGAIVITGLYLHGRLALPTDSPNEIVAEVWKIVDLHYVDPNFNGRDWKAVRQQYVNRSYTSKEEAYQAIREMLALLKDNQTGFLEPVEFRTLQGNPQDNQFEVGVQLQQDRQTNELTIVAPIEETPAARAGILPKDVLVKIDGTSTRGMNASQAVNLLRGRSGTDLVLTIRRGQQERDIKLTRTPINIQPVRYRAQTTPAGKIGYIRLNQFSANAVPEMRRAIEDLEQKSVAGYILDLRSNPGGLLTVSIDISRMWLRQGTIVSLINRNGERERKQAVNRALTDKPLAMLVDSGSAAASEIVAAAMQDNQRGVLVGTTTLGIGSVQSVRKLTDGSVLAVTIAKYSTPKGTEIEKRGVTPDAIVPITEQQLEALTQQANLRGTQSDLQYVKAQEVLLKLINKSK